MVKQVLIDVARDLKVDFIEPRSREQWARLMRRAGVKGDQGAGKRRSRTVPSTWRCHAQVLSRRVISAAPSELANKEVAESPHGLVPCDLISRPRCGVHRCRAGHTIDRANKGGRPFGRGAATKVDGSVICTDDVRNQGRPGRCDKAADSMLSKIDDHPPFADTLHIIRPGPASHRSIARQGDDCGNAGSSRVMPGDNHESQ